MQLTRARTFCSRRDATAQLEPIDSGAAVSYPHRDYATVSQDGARTAMLLQRQKVCFARTVVAARSLVHTQNKTGQETRVGIWPPLKSLNWHGAKESSALLASQLASSNTLLLLAPVLLYASELHNCVSSLEVAGFGRCYDELTLMNAILV